MHYNLRHMKWQRLYYGWIIVLSCFGINAVVHGIRYSFGVFFKSLSSDFELSRAATSGITGIYWVLCGGFALLGGWLLDKYGPKKIVLVMGVLTGLSLIATSRAATTWQLFLTYSVLLSGGTGAVYSVLMVTIQRWFVQRRGLATGIVSSGVGIGTIIMTPLTAYLVAVWGWRTTYLVMGLVMGAIFACLSFSLKRDPAEMGLQPEGAKLPSGVLPEIAVTAKKGSGPLKQAMRTRNFWLMAVIWSTWAFSLLLVLTHLVPHLTDIAISTTTAATITGMIGIVSIAGRLGSGWLTDRISRRTATILSILLQAGALFLLAWTRQTGMFYLFAVVYGLGYGALDPASLGLIGDTFDLRYLGRIMGAILVFWEAGAGIGAEVGGIIYDATGSYFTAFLLCGGMMLVSGLCALAINKQQVINDSRINNTNITNTTNKY